MSQALIAISAVLLLLVGYTVVGWLVIRSLFIWLHERDD